MTHKEQFSNEILQGIALLKRILDSGFIEDGNNKKSLINDIKYLEEQIDNPKLRLGIIGEFNAGKSTLLNTLLGKTVVATSHKPCTPVPIYINDGKPEQILVHTNNGVEHAELSDYERLTSEEFNSESIKQLNVTITSPFLSSNNVVIVDTPGINSNIPTHTKVTEATLENLHSAILLIYSKQPGSKATLDFLQNASRNIRKIFICISKADFLDTSQINRVCEELPKRIENATGQKIDNVFAITIQRGLPGGDFESFVNSLTNFMQLEFESIIRRDLRNYLSKRYDLLNKLLENQIILKEKLFYEFLSSKPVTSTDVLQKYNQELNEEFKKLKTLDESTEAISAIDNVIRKAEKTIDKTLAPEKKVFLFFDKRTSSDEIENVIESIKQLITSFQKNKLEPILKTFYNQLDTIANTTQATLATQLSELASTTENLETLLRDNMEDDPRTKDKIVAHRFKKFGIPLIVCGIITAIILNWQESSFLDMFIPSFLVFIGIALIGFTIITKNRIKRFIAKTVGELPFFNTTLKANVQSESIHFQNYTGTINTLDNLAEIAKTSNMDFRQMGGIANIGLNTGHPYIAVAAFAFNGVKDALADIYNFFRSPKAKDIAPLIISEIKTNISNAVAKAASQTIQDKTKVKNGLTSLAHQLIQRYETLIQGTFENNSTLIESLNKQLTTIHQLQKAIQKLSSSLDKHILEPTTSK